MKSFLFLALLLGSSLAQGTELQVYSPDKKVKVAVDLSTEIKLNVYSGDAKVTTISGIYMELVNKTILGKDPKVAKNKTISYTGKIEHVRGKRNTIIDNYQELNILFKGNYGIIVRAYNNGIAYRFYTTSKDSLYIKMENSVLDFPENTEVVHPYVHDLKQYSFERAYQRHKISELVDGHWTYSPIVAILPDGNRVGIVESDLWNYPSMELGKGNTPNSLKSYFVGYPAKEDSADTKYCFPVRAYQPYIAKTQGTRKFPWRGLVLVKEDEQLADNDLVFQLAEPSRIKDESWIKPGKVAWDWWNDNNLKGVPFRAGINTTTYKYFIDFAAKNHLEYVCIDDGWSDIYDLSKPSPDIDLKELIAYGASKNVGIILWIRWRSLYPQLEKYVAQYAKMGAKGFKIDFFERDDQKVVASLETIAAKCAEYKLLVDYHGIFRPAGINRTYPNVLNFEGIYGMEQAKWTADLGFLEQDVITPFTRLLAGPMDYTPGAMINATKADFRGVYSNPMSQGTRCHQLALYVVFDAPLNMLSDSPTNYEKETDAMDFLSTVPTVWDETKILSGEIGNHIITARKSSNTWYIGGLTNWTPKDITINFDFLGDGEYEADIYTDGINADRNAMDYTRKKVKVTKKSTLPIKLMSGGGCAIKVRKL